MQPTDTDYSWSFKSSVGKAQLELRKDLKTSAAAVGERPLFKCGPAGMFEDHSEGTGVTEEKA